MDEDTDHFVFPDMPDEVVVAVDQFLEAFYHRFESRYFTQLHRRYRALDQRERDNAPCRPGRSAIHRSDSLTIVTDDAAVTIADGPSLIVKISP